MSRMQAGRVAAAVCAAALGVAACGSSGSKAAAPKTAAPLGHAGDSAATLSGAYTKAVAARSAKMTVHVSIQLPGQSISTSGSGAFDWGSREGQVTLNESVQGQNINVTAILDGDDEYVQVPAAAQSAAGGKRWLKITISGITGGSSQSQDPAQTLALLEGSASSVQDLGPQTINGVATTHYQAQIDPSKAAANAETPAARQLLSQLPQLTGGATFPMDAWIDGQGLPRQISYQITLQKPPPSVPGNSPAAAEFPETTKVTMDLSDYGTPVSVTPPPASQVSTQSLSGLSGLGGS